MNASIYDYGSYTVPSASTDKTYIVSMEDKRWVCEGPDGSPCQHMKYNYPKTKQLCTHIKEHLINRLRARVDVLEKRIPSQSEAFFKTFDQVVSFYSWNKNEELSYIANLILSFGYIDGKVASDDVYEALGGEFYCRGVMGTAFKRMAQLEFIRPVSWKKSRVPKQHGRDIKVWILTDKAKDLFKFRSGKV